MKKIVRGLILSSAAGVAIYVAFAAHAEWSRVRETLSQFSWGVFAVALVLALANYFIRFLKWHFYLHQLGVRVDPPRSLCIFLSGFTLTLTPGKMGEVVKSYLLRESDGVSMARTAPIVVAERVTDLVALLLLAGAGAVTYHIGLQGLAIVGALLVAFLGLLSWERPMLAILKWVEHRKRLARVGHKAMELYTSMQALIRPRPLVVATALSVVAWGSECLAFWLVIRGFQGADAPLGGATAIYAASTVIGALTFLPGGLGVTEASMTLMLIKMARGVSEATALSATFIVRLATLWFGVGVGLLALLVYQRRHHVAMDEAVLPPAA